MKLISITKNKFKDFFFFHSYLGNKIFIGLVLSFLVGLMDGLGLAMFIPLLQLVDTSASFEPSSENLGNMKYLINFFNFLGLDLTINIILFFILFFFILKGIFRFVGAYYDVLLTTEFAKNIRSEAIESLSSVTYGYFLKLDQGRIQSSVGEETNRVRMAFSYYSRSIQAIISVLVYVVLAFLTNPQFALLVFIGGAFSNLFYKKLYNSTKTTSLTYTIRGYNFEGLVIQMVQNFKYLRASGTIKIFKSKIQITIDLLANSLRKLGYYNSILLALKEPISIAVVVFIIIIQVNFFEVAFGAMILSLLFFYRALNQIVLFQNGWNDFLNVSGSLFNYQDFIREMKRNFFDYEKGEKIDEVNSIELINVDFNYGEKRFIQKFNLKIEKNSSIAFVGISGSGKTTLINILSGLLPVNGGDIVINGKNLKNLSLSYYQSKVGYITQEPIIFNDTLYNNVTLWAPKTPENLEKFYKCIENAALSDFLMNSEFKEDIQLGGGGSMISGGQKQRVNIARELFKDVNLFIFDEATSALDSSTEREIQEYIKELKGNYTIIIIAHRLSTVKEVDKLYFLNDGKLQESGTFNELIIKSEKFRKLVSLQDFS